MSDEALTLVINFKSICAFRREKWTKNEKEFLDFLRICFNFNGHNPVEHKFHK